MSRPIDPRLRRWPLEYGRLMLRHPWLLAFTLIPNMIAPAIEPAQAWLAQTALDRLTQGSSTFMRDELIQFVPTVAAVFLILGSLKLTGKLVDKLYDERLFIALQRIYFSRRHGSHASEHITRTLNDCEQARKIADLLQKDIWQVVIGLPSVLIWQLNLASEWVLPLLLSTLPSLMFVAVFGPFIQRWSHARLRSQAGVSHAVGDGNESSLHQQQEGYFKASIRFELFKQGSEISADMMQWLGLLMILLISPLVPIIPAELNAGDLAAFLVNLKLIGKPIQEVAKMYAKVRESYPAVIRVLYPEHELLDYRDLASLTNEPNGRTS